MLDKISRFILIIGALAVIVYLVWYTVVWVVSITNGVVQLHERVKVIEKTLSNKGKN